MSGQMFVLTFQGFKIHTRDPNTELKSLTANQFSVRSLSIPSSPYLVLHYLKHMQLQDKTGLHVLCTPYQIYKGLTLHSELGEMHSEFLYRADGEGVRIEVVALLYLYRCRRHHKLFCATASVLGPVVVRPQTIKKKTNNCVITGGSIYI